MGAFDHRLALSIIYDLTPKIFNDQIANYIVQICLLMALSHSQYIKLQENS